VPGSYKTEAIVLRSLRFGEADRVLHLYSRERGRVGAIAKGVRRTRSRFGARLEPLTRVALVMHAGRGELHTVSAAEIVESHQPVRDDPVRLAAGLAGAEMMLRLFADGEPSEKAYVAFARFLEALEARAPTGAVDVARDPMLQALQLKLFWVAGFSPRLDGCASCGDDSVALPRFSAVAGGAVCARCGGGFALGDEAMDGLRALLGRPIAEAPVLSPGAADQVARAVAALGEEHGAFRLRSLARA
jgi:DNA repair protein RecO (recombination protein O)